ncbi:hypothetical protein SGRIM128S_06414 [Streptomyces griseomycini]
MVGRAAALAGTWSCRYCPATPRPTRPPPSRPPAPLPRVPGCRPRQEDAPGGATPEGGSGRRPVVPSRAVRTHGTTRTRTPATPRPVLDMAGSRSPRPAATSKGASRRRPPAPVGRGRQSLPRRPVRRDVLATTAPTPLGARRRPTCTPARPLTATAPVAATARQRPVTPAPPATDANGSGSSRHRLPNPMATAPTRAPAPHGEIGTVTVAHRATTAGTAARAPAGKNGNHGNNGNNGNNGKGGGGDGSNAPAVPRSLLLCSRWPGQRQRRPADRHVRRR